MQRRAIYASRSKIAFAAAAAILVGFVVGAKVTDSRTRKRALRRSNPDSNPLPYRWDEREVRRVVNSLVNAGERDPSMVSVEAASVLFGNHPSGSYATFPPGPEAPSGVACVWTRTVRMVASVFRDVRFVEAPMSEFLWVTHNANDPGYPWEEPTLHPDNMPTPGMFFDAEAATQRGDTLDAEHTLERTVRRALAQALSMANMDPNLATGTSNTSKRLRKELRQLISSSTFNDSLYGQTDLVKSGDGAYVLNSFGRGLNWLPVHADNLEILSQGGQPRRTTNLEGDALGAGENHMLLWIPALDLAALSDSIPRVQAYQWSDGTSTQEPPPVVQALGIDMQGVVL